MRRASFFVVLVCSVVASAAGKASALPPPQAVSFEIHQTPGDPNSPLRFTMTLHATAVSAKDNSVGWLITAANFAEPGNSGRAWVALAPTIGTSDNLWWVQHGDVIAPVAADFQNVPAMQGVALPMVHTLEPLTYSFAATASGSGNALGEYLFRTALTLIARTGDDDQPIVVVVIIDE